MEAATVIKPEHEGTRKHLLFTDEHEDLRESMEAWVKKELWPHRNEWEETTWPNEAMRRAGELGLPRTLLPGGVRRAGRRLLLLASSAPSA